MKKRALIMVLLLATLLVTLTACFPHHPGRHAPGPRHGLSKLP